MKTEVPDVITLDVEMPRMDGLTFLKKIMSQHPIPVIIVSSLTEKGTETALRAMEYGAVEIFAKPNISTNEMWDDSRQRLCDLVRAASVYRLRRKSHATLEVKPKLSADVMLKYNNTGSMIQTTEKVIAVGASTGGTEALKVFLESLPAEALGIFIVQQVPEMFTKSFANRLNEICKITVKEAVDGDSVLRELRRAITTWMSKEAIRLNAADKILPLTDIPGYVLKI